MTKIYKINYILGGSTNVENSLTPELAQALAAAGITLTAAQEAAVQAGAQAQAQALYDAAVAAHAQAAAATAPVGVAPEWSSGQMRNRITMSLKKLYEDGYKPIIDEDKNTITITYNGVKVVIKINPENYIWKPSDIEVTINNEKVKSGPALEKKNPATFRLSDIPKYLENDANQSDSNLKYFIPNESN